MAELTEGTHAREAIVSEANGSRSREQIVVLSGEGKVSACAILGRVTATGKYRIYDETNSDGSEVAAAMLLDAVDATSADADGAAIVRDAELKDAEVVWKTGVDEAGGKADLVGVNVHMR